MEYQVSARKYRPMTFDSVVGQEALTTTLKNAVRSGKLAHAFLFCGPRGVGKTTCARIFAKTINCEHPTENGEACGECESCKAFQEQRSLNVIELDAASNNGVEHIKQLMEQTRIPPQLGRYKVFIIDEVHMLSQAAFNAFLKTLEEPPSYVIFVLATTEKNKLLPTILSRCQIYDFDRMTVPNTVNHLKMVAEREGITYEEEALQVIAEKADGGMRDALSIFDQAASFCQGNITMQKVVEDLNLMDIDNYFTFTQLSLENKCAEVMVLLNKMLNNGMDGNNIVNGMASHVRNLLMARDQQTVKLLEVSERYHQRYAEQAKACTPIFLYKALQLLTRCDLNYRQSSNKRLLVELCFIEVAQITQPADEPASSPRGGNRLKILFKHIITSEVKAAPQVAAVAKPAANTMAAEDVRAMENAKAQANVEAPKTQPAEASAVSKPAVSLESLTSGGVRPKLKLSSLGGTFNNLRNQGGVAKVEEVEIQNKEEDKSFDDDDIRRAWLAMCQRMPKQYQGLASSMKLLRPHVVDFPNVEVVAPNTIIQDQLNEIRRRLEVTMAKDLHNGSLRLNVRLAEQSEIKRKLTKFELAEKMKAESPNLRKLISELELDLI